jgi:hypothetical protein
MNSLHEVGIAAEGLQRGRLIGLEEGGNILVWRIQMCEVEPGQRILEVSPDPLHGVQVRAIRWQEGQAHVRWEEELLGRMGAAVVQQQEMQAVRERLCD